MASVTTRAGAGRCGEAPALDGGQVLADGVHLPDRRAGGEQGAVHRLLVGERQAGRTQRQQRRSAARHQRQNQVVRAQSAHPLQQAPRAALAVGVRHGMRGLDHLDPRGGDGVAVAGDHGALQGDVGPRLPPAPPPSAPPTCRRPPRRSGPRGLAGRCAASIRRGSAAATAASKIALRAARARASSQSMPASPVAATRSMAKPGVARHLAGETRTGGLAMPAPEHR